MTRKLTLTKETLTRLQDDEVLDAVGASTGCPTLTVACNTTYCSKVVCPAPTLKNCNTNTML